MKQNKHSSVASKKAKATHKNVFIVYQKNEEPMVKIIAELLALWGHGCFYCRDEDRNPPGGTYRNILKENLLKADLVLLMISRSFRWSEYCQAEAGATATLSKLHIPIVIPPVISDDIKTVAPVLTGENIMKAVDSKQSSSFCERLKCRIDGLLKVQGKKSEVEAELGAKLEEELARCVRQYALNAPEKLLRVWPSLENAEAATSLVEHLKDSLNSSKDSSFSLVGVSLKFSLILLDRALEEFASERRPRTTVSKKVKIELVHMDDHAHILHALDDEIDKKAIRTTLSAKWPEMQTRWNAIGEACGLVIEVSRHVIDYIPPRVAFSLMIGSYTLADVRFGTCQRPYHLIY